MPARLQNLLLAWFLISLFLVIPCFWHSRIQAGDLGSHAYNAWLAQLVERGEITQLTIAPQWNNVLFDILLLKAANLAGFALAEKLVVSLCVLIFFWGTFAFLAAVSGAVPWHLMAPLAVLSYGYVFHMGFMNYYLSVGLAFLALALLWRGGAGDWLAATAVALVALIAHPIGFALFLGLAFYLLAARRVRPTWGFALAALAAMFFVYLRFYFKSHDQYDADWRTLGFVGMFGKEQMHLFGRRYDRLASLAFFWSFLAALGALYDWIFRGRLPSRAVWIALQVYLVTVVATLCLPENLRFSLYEGWVGLLVSRLTLLTAVFGLLGLACLRLPRWYWPGAAVCAAVFFAFLYADTSRLDRMEANARVITSQMPYGTRVVAVANAPDAWRIPFIGHAIERACIGHCFSVANYEPPSLQFRLRALPGSTLTVANSEKAEAMASGEYVVQPADLPLVSIYQCDDNDFTVLCALPLKAGQKTEDPETEPPVP